MYDKINSIIEIKRGNKYMRVKGICFNCGYITLDNTRNCEACGNLFVKVNIIDGKKLVNMNGEQRILESKKFADLRSQQIIVDF